MHLSCTLLILDIDTILLPNYTGSLGFGETNVRKLLGNCGTIDVQDCIASVRHLVKLGIAEFGPGKQFILGGSHGGFLGAHCNDVSRLPRMSSWPDTPCPQ